MEDKFPVLGSKPKEYIPLNVIKPHENQANINHMQTLEQLANRGGLSWLEILFVLEDKRYDSKTQFTEVSAKTKVLEFIGLQKSETDIALLDKEIIELMYLKVEGFNYIVRNEIGSVEVFINEPHRDSKSSGYITWVEGDYPMSSEELKKRKHVKLGNYNFVQFINEPILISDLIKNYKITLN